MYKDGAKIVDIERATGVLRASLYFELEKLGLKPNRNREAIRDARVQVELARDTTKEELLRVLAETQRELAETQARLDAVRAIVSREFFEATSRRKKSL